jgi:signal recognition particle subunit SRP54
MDQTVLKSLSPAQQVIKIVRDELLALFGDTEGGLKRTRLHRASSFCSVCRAPVRPPRPASLGGGCVARGATRCGVHRRSPARRHSAVAIVGEQAEVKVYEPETMDPVARAKGALAEARAKGFDTVIVDTAAVCISTTS